MVLSFFSYSGYTFFKTSSTCLATPLERAYGFSVKMKCNITQNSMQGTDVIGIRWNSMRRRMRRASAGGKVA